MQVLTPNFSMYDIAQEVPLADLALALEAVGSRLISREYYVESLPLFSFL